MKLLQDKKTPLIMGCFNITQDSFYSGSRYFEGDMAIKQAFALYEAGADIIDIGAESTRPGAKAVSCQEQLERLLPVVRELKQHNIPLSIDTCSPVVMRAVLDMGVDMINDVNALQHSGCVEVVAEFDCDVCLMHMQGAPESMQDNPHYTDTISEVLEFLGQRIYTCEQAGIPKQRICIDPGFGFGKKLAHNCQMLGQLSEFHRLNVPILVGISRKSMLGEITGHKAEDRLYVSISAAVIAAMQGAQIVRVHDVAATLDALKVVKAVQPYWQFSGRETANA